MSELTGDEIKVMIQRRINMKQKIKSHKSLGKWDHLTVLEALQCALSLTTDEEEQREIIADTRPGQVSCIK
jgi:hypothetical protein